MKKKIGVIGSLCAAVLILAGCGKNSESQSSAASQPATVAPSSASSPAAAVAAPPQKHSYAMVDNGSYGYEPALSEEDIRRGTATKPLIMMRYVGNKNGTFVILILGQDAGDARVVTRTSCQAPCQFAKSEVMAGDTVVKTETLRVTPDSIIGAMLADATSGQLVPYGQNTAAEQAAPQAAPPVSAPAPVDAPASTLDTAVPSPQQPQGDNAPLQQASFDCGKAKSIPEYLICHDPELAAADRDLAGVYQQAKDAVQDKEAFAERTRKQWNFREKNCRDKECLVSWYGYQKRVLTKIAETGDVSSQDQ